MVVVLIFVFKKHLCPENVFLKKNNLKIRKLLMMNLNGDFPKINFRKIFHPKTFRIETSGHNL